MASASTSNSISDEPPLPAQDDDRRDDSNVEIKASSSSHLEGIPLVFVSIGLALAVFCLGLDRSILATAIPQITSEFNSLEDVAWYGSAYLLTTCCFQLVFGKLYVEFDVKWVFISALGLFEVGSVVAGCAPNSIALIIGRAIQGVGCAGVLSGALTIIAQSLPLHKRPVYTGLIGSISGISQLIAPTLGGVFTDRATWRWCFWINLPLGAVTILVVVFIVKLPPKPKATEPRTFGHLFRKLDFTGTITLMPGIVSLLLALEWGGLTYPWRSWRVILCLTLAGVLMLTWLFIQYRQGEDATLPMRLMKQRSIASGILYSFLSASALFVVVYYVPIWFQAVKGASAEKSGINFLTTTAAMTVTAVLGGVLTSRIGYYVPQMFVSTVMLTVSAGLIYRYDIDTSTAYWAGSLVLFGLGAGIGIQMPLTAAQTVLKGGDIALGTSVLILVQTLGAAVFLAVGQNLFQNELVRSLARYAPDVDPVVVVSAGVADVAGTVGDKYGSGAVVGVLEAYNTALQECFLMCIILSALTLIGAAFMEWKNVKVESAKDNAKNEDNGELGLEKVASAV